MNNDAISYSYRVVKDQLRKMDIVKNPPYSKKWDRELSTLHSDKNKNRAREIK